MGKDDRIQVTMPKELKKQIRVEAAKRDISMAELVRKVLQEEFEGFGECNGGNTNRMTPETAD